MKQVTELSLQFVQEEAGDLGCFLRNAHVPTGMKVKFNSWTSPDCIPEEFKARGHEPPLPVPCSKALYPTTRSDDETALSPLLDEDGCYLIVQQLPETYVLICEYDLLRDGGLLYKR
ncbi:hypothetical protein lerEdw1_020145 [Lerista edwardsae]|nr:hypothetical protein lerEdw1_020145 [Lerista edwardsae]